MKYEDTLTEKQLTNRKFVSIEFLCSLYIIYVHLIPTCLLCWSLLLFYKIIVREAANFLFLSVCVTVSVIGVGGQLLGGTQL